MAPSFVVSYVLVDEVAFTLLAQKNCTGTVYMQVHVPPEIYAVSRVPANFRTILYCHMWGGVGWWGGGQGYVRVVFTMDQTYQL